jgi:lipid-A-disaccharide synthase
VAKALPFYFPAPAAGGVDILLIAGEHSGDEHAARLVAGLRAQRPTLRICALGGQQLGAAGAQVIFDLTASSVVGFVEVVKHYGFFKALFAQTLRWIAEHRPRAICLVDYPGFNLRLAASLYANGLAAKAGGPVKLLYYISPQIWAWKAGRRFPMAKTLDALACIFPFEVECYADTQLPVDFVGHPFLAEDYVAPVRYEASAPLLLLPGSRKQAVQRIWPLLREGYATRGAGDLPEPSDPRSPPSRRGALGGGAGGEYRAARGLSRAHLERHHVPPLCAGRFAGGDCVPGQSINLSARAVAG